MATVSEARLRRLGETLAGFETRHTLSDTSSRTRGIGAARQWIFDELCRSSAKLQVSFDTCHVAQQGRITRSVELRNVMAVLPGRSDRRIHVTAHDDTVNSGAETRISSNSRPAGQPAPDAQLRAGQDYDVAAPAGANDNGSGTALTMEVARVFAESGVDFDATLVFVLWAGEEQGLIGARARNASRARTSSSKQTSTTATSVAPARATASSMPSLCVCTPRAPKTPCRGRSRDTSREWRLCRCRPIASA